MREKEEGPHTCAFLEDCASQSSSISGGRGAAEASGVKLRLALAQEGCSKGCLHGEVDVWHGQSDHSSLRLSLN